MNTNPRLKSKQCLTCGSTFLGGPRAMYCPECRTKRSQLRNPRKVGSTDICTVCGAPYIINASQRKYCTTCQKQVARQQRFKKWLRDYGDPEKLKTMADRAQKKALEYQEDIIKLLQHCYNQSKKPQKKGTR